MLANEDHSFCSSSSSGSRFSDVPTTVDSSSRQIMNKRGTGATISTAENKAVYRIRLMVMFFLTMSTIGTACLVYFNARNSEQEQFEADFEYLASKVFNHLGSSIEASLGAIDGFVVSIVSFALHSNMTWPYVTIPDYGTRASKVRSVTRSVLIAEIRIIRSSQRAKWDEYSLEVGPSWVDENIAVQNSDPTFTGMRVDEYNVSGLWGSQPGATFNLPMWQSYPTLPLFGYSPFNLDLTLLPSLSLALPALKERKAVVGGISNAPGGDSGAQTNELIKFYTENESTITEPLSELYYPIFEDAAAQVLARNTSGAAMASILGTWFYWRDFMKDILPSGNNGIIVVFENGCNQTFSYRIDGPDVIFLGYRDAHDRKYNVYEVVSTLINLLRHSRGNQVYTGLLLADEICPYNVRLYPSETFEDHYVDSDPIMYMSMTIAIFVFTTLVFLCYDFLMERRQKKLLSTAVKSSAIVSSLFPQNVRARLYGTEGQDDTSYTDSQKNQQNLLMIDSFEDRGRSLVERSVSTGRPIADLFPSATVIFGDLAGFTAWSSTREPSQVFILLESLYTLFDALATKRKVFKVETIGDCYMAVVGLPDPCPEHAVVSVKFAQDCIVHMLELNAQLAFELGPDTEDLAMRFGLHSGAVTAGVLRGQKSRFQLFGDTVNTASRMETTGLRNRIHISETTAHELTKFRKENWICPRKDSVQVKGKGQMMTYWVNPIEAGSSCLDGSMTSTSQTKIDGMLATTLDRTERLINWNTDVLAKLLSTLVARSSSQKYVDSGDLWKSQVSEMLKSNTLVLDEVKDVIDYPEIYHSNTCEDPDAIRLDSLVLSQLREFVESIAEMYRSVSNPFHNFEHASHVCMSVAKLMSRIVANDNYFDHSTESGSVESFSHQRILGITSDPLTRFACAFTALIHDAAHPGVPNTQLVKESSVLAVECRNRCVAEQQTVVEVWELFMSERYHALRNTICPNPHELQHFRQLVVNCVMSTDVFDIDLKQLRDRRWKMAFGNCIPTSDSTREAINRKATIVIELLIQVSDVAHTMQHWHVYRKWNELLFEEMLKAYEAGKADKHPAEFWYKGELEFFDTYVLPLAEQLSRCGVFGVFSDEYSNYAMENRDEWELKGKAIVAEMAAKLENQICSSSAISCAPASLKSPS